MELLAQNSARCDAVEVRGRCCLTFAQIDPNYSSLSAAAKAVSRAKLVSAVRKLGQRQPGPARRAKTNRTPSTLVIGKWPADGYTGPALAEMQRHAQEWLQQQVHISQPRAKRARIGEEHSLRCLRVELRPPAGQASTYWRQMLFRRFVIS